MTPGWVRKTVARLIRDNVHHAIYPLWEDIDGKPVDPDSEDYAILEEMLEAAADNIERFGVINAG